MTIGRAALICAFWNIFWGIELYAETNGGKARNTIAFGSYLGALFLLYLNMETRAGSVRDAELYSRVSKIEEPTQQESSGKESP